MTASKPYTLRRDAVLGSDVFVGRERIGHALRSIGDFRASMSDRRLVGYYRTEAEAAEAVYTEWLSHQPKETR